MIPSSASLPFWFIIVILHDLSFRLHIASTEVSRQGAIGIAGSGIAILGFVNRLQRRSLHTRPIKLI